MENETLRVPVVADEDEPAFTLGEETARAMDVLAQRFFFAKGVAKTLTQQNKDTATEMRDAFVHQELEIQTAAILAGRIHGNEVVAAQLNEIVAASPDRFLEFVQDVREVGRQTRARQAHVAATGLSRRNGRKP